MGDKYQLIIFDCDGTLVDTEYLNNQVSSDLLIELGLTEYTVDRCLTEFAGRTWSDIKILLEERHNTVIPQDIIQTYISRVHKAMETQSISVKGGVEFVGLCHKNYKIAVGSNGERTNVYKSLLLGGYDSYFQEDNIFTKVQVARGKPAPDLFLLAAEKMDISPSRTLVIEDSVTGAKAGLAAGMDVWGFTGVSHNKEMAESAFCALGVVQVFDDFIHMREALKL